MQSPSDTTVCVAHTYTHAHSYTHTHYIILQVPTAKQVDLQYQSLLTECETCTQSPYTPATLPLILHQFYCDRIGQLVQLKHMHLVRWARFAVGQSKVTEELQGEFQERME